MFNRDQDGAEDLASDQSFPWPPPGFRDRRSHFGRTTDPASSASSFGTPHRKSSDQVIQSLRDELDKHRQMFFDRLAPQWEPTGHRQTGFPFTDGGRRAFSGMDRTMPQHHPHQHPSYAFHQNDIPAWMTEDDVDPAMGRAGNRQRWPSSGSGRSAGSNSSAGSSGPETGATSQKPAERSDSPSRPRIHKPAARSATGDFPVGSPAASSPKGFSRASSAPPVAPHPENDSQHTNTGTPRRLFTTTIHHQPSPGNVQQPTGSNTDSPGPNRRHANTHQPNSSGNTSSHVRHIPIMVEGRDEPLLPSVAEESAQTAAEKRSKTAIPMPFYPKTTTHKPDTSSAPSEASFASPPSANKKQEEAERDASVAIPLPYDRLSDDSGKSVGSTTSADTVNDLQLIERIQRETESLLPRIEAFQGDRHDRGFLFLDEMLTRLLLKLDNVQIEGRDDVRQARRKAIASITHCINLLESKLLNSIERSNEGEAVNSSQQQDDSVKEQTKIEEQPTNAPTEGNPNTSPATHVSQLMINIPFQEANSAQTENTAPE